MSITVTADAATIAEFKQRYDSVHANVSSVIRGKSAAIQLALTAMLAEGHVLLDDVPGTGKTSMAKALARSIQGDFSRIQFTPDLLPTDVTGSMIYRPSDSKFEFHPGGVFANVVLADEVNRASPKTQSALLEVMQEQHVTVDSIEHNVPRPFVVIATQNPVEFDGTYHLPEAQVDRFMLRMSMEYPDHASETQIISDQLAGLVPEDLSPVISIEEFDWMIKAARSVHVAEGLKEFVVTIVGSTRRMEELRLGVSPRGSIALVRASQAWAASRGNHFVTADDIIALAPFVLGHRMLLTPEAELQGLTAQDLVARTISAVPVPVTR